MHQSGRTDKAVQAAGTTQPFGDAIARSEGIAASNGIELWYETFGDPSDPAVLLIMGAGTPATFWPEELCDRVAAAGRFAVRFDNRDSGRSTWLSEASSSPRELARDLPYTLRDMAHDAVGLMDALVLERAHLVGASLGAGVAKLLAVDFPARVMSLTLLGHGQPVPRREAEEAYSQAEEQPESDITDDEWIDLLTDGVRAATGPLYAFDEKHVRANWTQTMKDGWSPAGSIRQRAVFFLSEQASLETVADLGIPILSLEGTADPGFEWVKQVSKGLPNTRFEAIEGMGHELPPAASELIATHIIEHTDLERDP